MSSDQCLPAVSRRQLREHVVASLERYWPGKTNLLATLPVREMGFPDITMPLRLVAVQLPDWAVQCGIDGEVLVPEEACDTVDGSDWRQVDWYLAAFLMLECWHERVWEQRHGPIHSYSFRLKGWDTRIWTHAWVNRIALFLRAWMAFEASHSEDGLIGPLPPAEIELTHDVDAVSKTLAIRLKQGAFLSFNAVRFFARGDFEQGFRRVGQSFEFVFSNSDWWTIPVVLGLERDAGVRSCFNFYADNRAKTPKRWLFDPGYDIHQPRLSKILRELVEGGWSIGLHQSYDAWGDEQLMRMQRARLQAVANKKVDSCRQHWLRFSWRDTWRAQAGAGLLQDATLMFNDRPGFRPAAALSWKPWDARYGHALSLVALPTVFMDSHLYDYQTLGPEHRKAAMARWLGEISAVRGQAALLWHPHTLVSDYGWAEGFCELLGQLKEVGACSDM